MEGARGTGGRRLPSLEIASGIEGQHKLLPALVPDKRIVTLHEFRNSFRGSRAMVAIHWATVEICVFDDKVASRCDQRRVRVQLRQDVLFPWPESRMTRTRDLSLACCAPDAGSRLRSRTR